MRLAKKIAVAILVVLITIQFIQPARNRSGQVLPTDISKVIAVPKTVQALLQTACYDCHSNHTEYPWYIAIQPMGWMMQKHIQDGKQDLNFSDFGAYTSRRQLSKLKAIASQVENGAMPLSSYTWMHKKARLTRNDKALLINWARNSLDSLQKSRL